jgi:hypothetical protein
MDKRQIIDKIKKSKGALGKRFKISRIGKGTSL